MGITKADAQTAEKEGAYWVESEQPRHAVELSEYFIGKYLVTNREYQAFIRDTKYHSPNGWDRDLFPPDKSGHPVVNVSWNDATAYCKWLSRKTRKRYRLPTEAEWEKAARGYDGRIFPWGNNFDPRKANTIHAEIGDTSEVGKFSPQGDSPYGCVDMIGNVWEWCADWVDDDLYKKRAENISKDPFSSRRGEIRVLRGGSFLSNKANARCARRYGNLPGTFDGNGGFRVAMSSTK